MNADGNEQLKREVRRRVDRIERAERERRGLLAESVFLGTLAGIFVVPVVIGAYVGNWLDSRQPGYSVAWTTGLIVAGVFVGAVNVYLYVRGRA